MSAVEPGLVDAPDASGLLDGLVGPVAGHDVVGGPTLREEVERHHRELQRRATLQEQDPVRVRDAGQRAKIRLGLGDDPFERGRAVADLHDRHADARQRHEIALRLLEDGQRQHRRAGREVVDALGHGRLSLAAQRGTSWALFTMFGTWPVSMNDRTIRTVSAATASCAWSVDAPM